MDVDCSNVDVNKSPAAAVSDVPEMSSTSPSLEDLKELEDYTELTTEKPPEIDEAVEFIEGKNITDLTANDTLKDSGLTKLDINKTTEAELKSEFCREVSQIAGRFEASLNILKIQGVPAGRGLRLN